MIVHQADIVVVVPKPSCASVGVCWLPVDFGDMLGLALVGVCWLSVRFGEVLGVVMEVVVLLRRLSVHKVLSRGA